MDDELKVADVVVVTLNGGKIRLAPKVYTLKSELMFFKITDPEGRVMCYPYDNVISLSFKEVQNE